MKPNHKLVGILAPLKTHSLDVRQQMRFEMTKQRKYILVILGVCAVLSTALAFSMRAIDNSRGPFRITQGLADVLMLPLVVILGVVVLLGFLSLSESSARDRSPIVRAQSPGWLIFGLIIGVGFILNYTAHPFIEGIQVLTGSRPVRTGYAGADDLRNAYSRACSAHDQNMLTQRLFSKALLDKLGDTGLTEHLSSLPQQGTRLNFTWHYGNYKTNGLFTVVISHDAASVTRVLECAKTEDGWKVIDVR